MTPSKRPRATSPFIPTARQLAGLADAAPLRQALAALPDPARHPGGPMALDDLPVVVPQVRVDVTADQRDQAQAVLEAQRQRNIHRYAKNSRRSIRSDWRHWIAFCVSMDRVAMPVAESDLMDFLDALIDAGYRRATLDHLLFTLRLASKLWGCPDPLASLVMEAYWKDRCRPQDSADGKTRGLSKAQHQATGLTIGDVLAVIEATDRADPRALRDAAMVSVAYDAMTRASELVAMRWDALLPPEHGDAGAVYVIGHSKTDQEGAGATVYLQPRSLALLAQWKTHAFPENPYLFHALPRYAGQALDRTRPLSVRAVARIFAHAAKVAGIDKAFSGHSTRVGAAQDMTQANLRLAEIMHIGRWRSPRMPARYAAHAKARRSGRARAKAMATLLPKGPPSNDDG